MTLEDVGNIILMVSIVFGIALFTKVNADYCCMKEEKENNEQ